MVRNNTVTMSKGNLLRTAIFSFIVFLLFSCGNDKRNPLDKLEPVDGGVFYGGTFRYNEVEYFRSLYPHSINEAIGLRIGNQVYEGLTRLSQRDLSVKPCLAQEWTIDSTFTVYTFKIRKGVYFHNDKCFKDGKGRQLTAHDFKYCFDQLCSANSNNKGFYLFEDKVVGATKYYNASLTGEALPNGVEGIQVIDDYTLEIRLEHPFPAFPAQLSMQFTWVFPQEAVKAYGNDMRTLAIGTGPFKLKELREDEAVVMMRNENYWDKDQYGNQLPYLSAIKVSFFKEQKTELLEFKKGNLDMVYRIPLEMYDEIITKEGELAPSYNDYQLQTTPSLNMQYYGFMNQKEPFNNVKVRQAFNYAIDKQKIVNYTLKGMGIAALYGTVPPALVGYNAKSIKGYSYDPDKAKQLLAEAGYPNGENFPEINLQINSGGGRNMQVAEAIQRMLEETLNINVSLSVLPFPQHLENIDKGKALFWRSGWVADYPDPEAFFVLIPRKLCAG